MKLRPFLAICLFSIIGGAAFGQGVADVEKADFGFETQAFAKFALLPPTDEIGEVSVPSVRISEPLLMPIREEAHLLTLFGDVSVFKNEQAVDGLEGVVFGSEITSGAASAGFSLFYENEIGMVERSDLFLDYQVTDGLSLGVSRTLSLEADGNGTASPAFGLNASLSRGNATLQGSVANAGQVDPVFGLSVGLSF